MNIPGQYRCLRCGQSLTSEGDRPVCLHCGAEGRVVPLTLHKATEDAKEQAATATRQEQAEQIAQIRENHEAELAQLRREVLAERERAAGLDAAVTALREQMALMQEPSALMERLVTQDKLLAEGKESVQKLLAMVLANKQASWMLAAGGGAAGGGVVAGILAAAAHWLMKLF